MWYIASHVTRPCPLNFNCCFMLAIAKWVPRESRQPLVNVIWLVPWCLYLMKHDINVLGKSTIFLPANRRFNVSPHLLLRISEVRGRLFAWIFAKVLETTQAASKMDGLLLVLRKQKFVALYL